MSRRRKLFLVIAAACLAMYVGLSMLFRQTLLDEGVEIGGGWRTRFVTADMGQIKYTSDSTAKAFIRSYVPRQVQSILRMKEAFQVTHSRGDKSQLLVLFQEWCPQNHAPFPENQYRHSMEFIESSGFVFRYPYSGRYSLSTQSHGLGVISDYSAFPRRDPQLHFRVLNEDFSQVLLDHTIPNPGYQPSFPEWSPQALPITQTVGPVTMTLTEIKVHQDTSHLESRLTPQSTDPTWENPRWYTFYSDATGNRGPWLSPHEPAWKVTVQAHRRLDVEFLPEETWKLASLSAPVPVSSVALQDVRTVNGVEIKLLRLFGPGEYRIENDQVVSAKELMQSAEIPESRYHDNLETGRSGATMHYTNVQTDLPGIWIGHTPLPELKYLEVRIRDQLGRDLCSMPVRNSSAYTSSSPSRFAPFQPFPDSTSIEIAIVVHKGLEFEFVVKPPVMTAR